MNENHRAAASQLPHFTRRQLEAVVSSTLLHLGDVLWLSGSPLVELRPVKERALASRSLFAEGRALSEVMSELTQDLTERLIGDRKVELIRAALCGVLQGASIAQVARDQRMSRENFTRRYWRMAVAVVAEEVAAMGGQPMRHRGRPNRNEAA